MNIKFPRDKREWIESVIVDDKEIRMMIVRHHPSFYATYPPDTAQDDMYNQFVWNLACDTNDEKH